MEVKEMEKILGHLGTYAGYEEGTVLSLKHQPYVYTV